MYLPKTDYISYMYLPKQTVLKKVNMLSLAKIFFSRNQVNSSKSTRDKNTEFVNNVDLDEVDYKEPPHLDLHCLSSRL